MKLSTRSRYGTRMLVDMAQHYNEGPIQVGDIAKRQAISVKYLEQIIIPLKRAGYLKSIRGPKGGHVLARRPEEITVGEIVAVLERGTALVECAEKPEVCSRSDGCLTRPLWAEAGNALFSRLGAVSLADLVRKGQRVRASTAPKLTSHAQSSRP